MGHNMNVVLPFTASDSLFGIFLVTFLTIKT